MKKTFFVFSLMAATFYSLAQAPASYDKSVFSSYNKATPLVQSTGETTTAEINLQFPSWSFSVDKLNGTIRDMYGPAISLPNTALVDKAQYCMDHFKSLNVNKAHWQVIRNLSIADASYVDFSASLTGHAVVFSKLSFRYTAAGQLIRIQMKNYGETCTTLPVFLSQDGALQAAKQNNQGATITTQKIDSDWAWFPVPIANGYELHPAWHYVLEGVANAAPVLVSGYIDATDGTVLYQTNEVKETDLTVKGNAYLLDPATPPVLEPLSNLKVTVNGSLYYTDTNGAISDPAINISDVATIPLDGRWVTVMSANLGNAVPSFNNTLTAATNSYTYPETAPSSDRHVNVYYHVNKMHDFMKGYFPSFTGMDFSLPAYVDVSSGSCNAFYSGGNGGTITFYAAGGGCSSFADWADITYHEYGHGISDKFYNSQGAGTIQNGALNEGMSDVWAMSVTHNPVLGANAIAGSYIRRYDINPKVYPIDITGEVHADGEMIAGSWWDVAVNLGSVDSMTKLFVKTYYDVPDGPTGTEGEIYHSILIDALLNDDVDNNINNGTPHFNQIVAAFAKHGIYLLSDATLVHQELDNQKAGSPITVTASLTISDQAFLRSLTLFYRTRGDNWDSLVMTNNGNFNFQGQIPAQTSAKIMDYYFVVKDTLNMSDAYFPTTYTPLLAATATSLPYQFGVGLVAIDSNTFETPVAGWTIGNAPGDNATKGIWLQAAPVGSTFTSSFGSLPCQTAKDHTTGTGQCLVTGNANSAGSSINSASVGLGTTTVLTPVFDLSGYSNPVIEYYRWYSNDRGNNTKKDDWQTGIRIDGSAFWIVVDKTNESDYSWRRRIFAIKEYTSSKKIQMRFVATNAPDPNLPNNGSSVVEAAVDDFYIYDRDALDVSNVNAAMGKVKIYPNPANNQLQITLPANNPAGTISLYDLSGKAVYQGNINANASDYTLNTTNLASAQYMLIIQTNKTIQSQKVTVSH